MRNRFNIKESEKNRIRDLHGIGIIKEQWTEIKLDEVQDEVVEGPKPDFLDLDKDGDKKEPMKKAAKEVKEQSREAVFVEGQEDLLGNLSLGAKSLLDFIKNEHKPYGEGFLDLTDIQTHLNETIDAYVEITKQARADMGYNNPDEIQSQ